MINELSLNSLVIISIKSKENMSPWSPYILYKVSKLFYEKIDDHTNFEIYLGTLIRFQTILLLLSGILTKVNKPNR